MVITNQQRAEVGVDDEIYNLQQSGESRVGYIGV